jgi:hypothetical protein
MLNKAVFGLIATTDSGTSDVVRFVDGDFECKVGNGAVTIAGYKGSTKDAAIPGVIGGLPVTAIGERAFLWSQLTSITIPDSVTAIGDGTFYRNQLTSITIGVNVNLVSNPFPKCFTAFYNNRKAAGTYGRSSASSTTGTKSGGE